MCGSVFILALERVLSPDLDASFALVQAMERGLDLGDQVGRRRRSAVLGKGLSGASSGQSGSRPSGDDSWTRIRTVVFESVSPM